MVDDMEEKAFEFAGRSLRVICRKTLQQTINFNLTMQCEVHQLFESLRDFGGGYPSDSDSGCSSPGGAGEGRAEVPAGRGADEPKPDLLGLDIWPAALELCAYLASHPSLVQGRNVLELGAGVGLPGLLAAQLGARSVVLTDYEPTVRSRGSTAMRRRSLPSADGHGGGG